VKSQTLLIIGAGIEQIPAIVLAKKMGLHVVVSDMNPKAPGFKYADNYFLASTYDLKATVRQAIHFNKTNRKINGVITVASDIPLTVAKVAKALDLPGNSIESATLAQDKLLMKQHFKKYGVPIPFFSQVNNKSHFKKLIGNLGFPIVCKPADSRGARGVLLLNKEVDLEWAYNYSKSFSPTQRVMVEEYLEGPQISTESFIYNEFSITPGIADRNYSGLKKYLPFIIENGGTTPSQLPDLDQSAIKKTAELAAAVLGIKRNSAKGDLVLTKDGPKVIEIAARISGGYFATNVIPLVTGVNLVKSIIEVALGQKPNLEELIPKKEMVLIQRYFFPKAGRLKEVKGVKAVREMKFVRLFMIYVNVGDIIGDIENHPGRAGVFVVSGYNYQEALKNSERIQKTIEFMI
jgi:biotin carboxylase